VNEEHLDVAIQTAKDSLKTALGVTDEQLSRQVKLATGHGGTTNFEDCETVKTDKRLSIANIVMQSALLVTLLLMLRTKSLAVYRTWMFLGLCSIVLVAVQWRHSLSLASKVMWEAGSVNTRALLLLTALYVIVSSAFQYLS
jgi:hypothetical protein